MSDFKIVERLQKMDVDIQRNQLKYHAKRVLISKEFTFDAAHHLHHYEGGNVKICTVIPIELY